MPARQCYTSPDFERDGVFARNWVCVGRTDQLATPGDAFSFSVAGELAIIARGRGGDIRAMGAVCRHRGHVLSCGGDNRRASSAAPCRRFRRPRRCRGTGRTSSKTSPALIIPNLFIRGRMTSRRATT
ncbi:MAG: Rieske 2Fe-2S domain-containing protein [Alphaproteobacteria bacterium]|nr:Rieske 2Fe-2S domain-containing protein [Alphaproteobacteria bacterium]